MRARQAGKIAVLVIDEAHKLAPAVLEEVRLLSNLELPGEKLLQIVLAGQDELLEMLRRPELRQISQRISVRLVLSPLAPADVEQYIALRWAKAGAQAAPPFDADAYSEIALWSRGIPRLVNALCDNALIAAFRQAAGGGVRITYAKPRATWIDSPRPRRSCRSERSQRGSPGAGKARWRGMKTPRRGSRRRCGAFRKPVKRAKTAVFSRWMTRLRWDRQEAR